MSERLPGNREKAFDGSAVRQFGGSGEEKRRSTVRLFGKGSGRLNSRTVEQSNGLPELPNGRTAERPNAVEG